MAQLTHTPPVFLPAEVTVRVESLLPYLSDMSRSDANFLLGARAKIGAGRHLDRGELFRLNCDRLREFVLRRAQGATAPRTTPAVFSLQILQMYETAAQVDKVGCNGTPLQPQGPMTTETQGVEPQETVLVEAPQPEQ